jgi:hydroxyethylthiazole kinase-like uncharacterized protein yjeF
MRRAHTVEQVRAAEADLMARLPEGTLMQRAATGLAVAISNFLGHTYGARVVLLIGSGDNGGDALYAGVRLARRGALVTAVLLSDKAHAAGLEALLAVGGRVGSAEDIAGADVVVDGIVGIGGRPGLRPDALAAVELATQKGVPIVAVDTPSGVDVDTGETPEPHVRAALTVTFGTHKICHLIDPAATACGPVHLVEIGLDLPPAAVESLQASDVPSPTWRVRQVLPRRTRADGRLSAVPGRCRHRHGRCARRSVGHGPVRRPGRSGGRSPGGPPGDRCRRWTRAGVGRGLGPWRRPRCQPGSRPARC